MSDFSTMSKFNSTPDPTPPLTTAPTPADSITAPATPLPEPICTPLHALYCFDILNAKLTGVEAGDPPFPNPRDEYALFVTWNTDSHHRHNGKPALRGCIGNFSPMPLAKGLKDYALVSALEDHRFSPVKASELPHLSCLVSLLTPFTSIPSPLDWTPGIHGIHITFPHPDRPSRTLSATYLPEIAIDQKWTKEETIKSAIQKAGYRGRVEVGGAVWKSLKVKVYGSEVAGVNYSEWKKWREARAK